MSLLMDALKRAEASKSEPADAGKSAAPGNGPELTLEDEGPAAASQDLPRDAEPHLADLDAALEAAAREELGLDGPEADSPPAARAPTEPDAGTQRAAANTLFAAKAGTRSAWRHRAPFLAVVGALLLVGAGAAYYVWSELDKLTQSSSGLVARSGSIRAPLPPLPATPAAASVTPPAATAPVVEATPVAAAPAPSSAPGAGATAGPVSTTAPDAAAPTAVPAPRAEPVFRRKPAPPALPAPAMATTPGVTVSAAASPAQAAHAAMLRGDRDAAERIYRNLLASDARNVDALVGLASLALDRHDAAAAEHLYLNALEADPKSATAQAGLINLHGQRDPSFAESRLKVLLGNLAPGSPAAAGVLFVLGNHYARQARWNEAQRAYFEAYSLDSGNPDYQFNLAVALEHLQKGPLALNFYRGALAAAGARAASFDRQQAKDRIDALDAAAR